MLGRLIGVWTQLRHRLALRKYTPYTIAEYFRRQGAQIGDGCFIVPTRLSTEPYLIRIGNHVAIASGATLITHDGGAFMFRSEVPDLQGFGPIVIEDNCMIGQNAIVFPGVRIGPNAIVGAGSVVVTDVPPNSIVMGVPARPFGSLERYREKCIERWREQRPHDIVLDEGETWWNSRHFRANRARLQAHLVKHFEHQLAPASQVRE